MNARRFGGLVLASLAAVVLTTGCERARRESIDAAKSALEAAKSAGAETYVLQAYAEAEKVLAEAMKEVEIQNERSMFSRSYSEANQLLTKAKDLADEAKKRAEQKREEWKRDAEVAIEEAEAALVTAREATEKAGVAKRDALKGRLEEAGTVLFDAEKALKAGSFIDAHAKAEDATAWANEVSEASGSKETKRVGRTRMK